MTNENMTQATLKAWQAQLAQVRQRRLARGAGRAGLAPVARHLGFIVRSRDP